MIYPLYISDRRSGEFRGVREVLVRSVAIARFGFIAPKPRRAKGLDSRVLSSGMPVHPLLLNPAFMLQFLFPFNVVVWSVTMYILYTVSFEYLDINVLARHF